MDGTYFDAVLSKNMAPVFNGTPAEVAAWLKKRRDAHSHAEVDTLIVCEGKSMKLVKPSDYLVGK